MDIKDTKVLEGPLGELIEQCAAMKAQDSSKPSSKSFEDRANWVREIWSNNGFEDARDQYDSSKRDLKVRYLEDLCSADTYTDAVSTSDIPLLIGRVISEVVKEAAEPILVGTTLLNRISFSAGPTITFPAMGAIQAFDIAEGMEYPEQTMPTAGTTTCTIGKSGLKVRFTEETIRYSRYDVMGMHLRAAGRALARHKEEKIFTHINSLGETVFDNVDPSSAVLGATTGRGIDGNYNGTITMEDLLDMYARVVSYGFIPNTLIMHPMAWTIFAKDPTMRSWAFAQGGPIWQGRQGSPGLSPQSGEPMGMGPYWHAPNTATTQTPLPSIFPEPMTLIITPFVPYDSSSYDNPVTSIMMCDRMELGALVVDEEISTEEWDDPARDIRAVKFRERYGIAILNEGKAVAVAKNVVVARAYDYEDRSNWDVATATLPSGSFSL
jgi:hypothetical protein